MKIKNIIVGSVAIKAHAFLEVFPGINLMGINDTEFEHSKVTILICDNCNYGISKVFEYIKNNSISLEELTIKKSFFMEEDIYVRPYSRKNVTTKKKQGPNFSKI